MELHSITPTIIHNGWESTVNKGMRESSPTEVATKGSAGPEDTVTISQEGRDKTAQANSTTDKSQDNLTEQQHAELQQLKSRDTEVRTHEQAHLSAAGQYAKGGASFTYEKGPDGGSYAVAGEVGIDVSKESTPEATIAKMQTIERAALAPADPSAADKRIAAQASAKEAKARQDLLQVKQEDLLRGESTEDSVADGQGASRNKNPKDFSTDTSIAMKLAVYKKMAAH